MVYACFVVASGNAAPGDIVGLDFMAPPIFQSISAAFLSAAAAAGALWAVHRLDRNKSGAVRL